MSKKAWNRGKVKVVVDLDVEDRRKLVLQAREEGCSVSALVEQSLRKMVNEHLGISFAGSQAETQHQR